MKKIFFFLVLMLLLIKVSAQDVQLVTLQKAERTQVFYGANAFKEAMVEAEHGNTITLSAGSFKAVDITKAVKIYGVGYEVEAKMKTSQVGKGTTTQTKDELPKYSTRLIGDFVIALDSINEQPAKGLYMEGIYSNNTIRVEKYLEDALFVKCKFLNVDFLVKSEFKAYVESKNCLFSQCRFTGWLELGTPHDDVVSNCIIYAVGHTSESATALIQNSVIMTICCGINGIVLKNNIIKEVHSGGNTHDLGGSRSYPLYPTCSAYHNMAGSVYIFQDLSTKDENWLDEKWATTLFGEGGIDKYDDTYMYELTDEAKATYIGTDGKPIGLYGGTSPFSPILTIPRIVKKDIADETVDGKLKVNIKVETGDDSL